MAEEDLCLLLNPKRYFVRGRKLEYILDCLLEPERYEAFIQNSIFYQEDLHEFHLAFADIVSKFKVGNNGKLSGQFISENLPNLLCFLQKTIHHRIPEDILPLLGILSEIANVHDWVNDIPNLKELVYLFREHKDYMKIFFDGVQNVLLRIFREMETQDSQGDHMMRKFQLETIRLNLQILENDLRSREFIARPIAPIQLVINLQVNAFVNELAQKLGQRKLGIAKLNKDIMLSEQFNWRCQQQIGYFTNEKKALQAQNNKTFAELLKSRQKVKELSGYLQNLPVSEHQPFPIRTIGANYSNDLFEYDGQQLRRAHTLGFRLDNQQQCVQLSDGSLFVCGYTTCIITPDNKVREIAKMNKSRNFSAIVKVDQRIYVFGGRIINMSTQFEFDGGITFFEEISCAEAEYYDIDQNTWTNIQPLPDARHGCGAAYHNGSIYVGGGGNRKHSPKYNEILRYDINSNTYTPTNMTSRLLTGYEGTSLFIIGNTLYSVRDKLIASYNIDTQQHLRTVSTFDYRWWSCMPPLVQGDAVILALTDRNKKLVRLNYKTRGVEIIGELEYRSFQVQVFTYL